MRILVVDDNYSKVKEIHRTLQITDSSDFIDDVRTATEALEKMAQDDYDIVIIDMQIPEVKGGDISPRGGLELIQEIETSIDIYPPKFVIGLTQHTDDFQALRDEVSIYGCQLFLIDDEKWIPLLRRKYQSLRSKNRCKNFEIAVASALYEPELTAFLNLHGVEYETFEIKGKQFFDISVKTKNGKSQNIVAAACERMGVSTATSLATRLILNFRPRLLLMNGICAGEKGSASLGDIIVAEHCWDYSSGKVIGMEASEQQFQSDPHHVSIDNKINRSLTQIANDEQYSEDIFIAWKGKRPDSPPKIRIGPMACGAQVVADENVFQNIKVRNRKVIGLDMESYGFMNACNLLDTPSVVIKSVCDYANNEKNDDFQSYAAYTSAAFILKVIEDQIL